MCVCACVHVCVCVTHFMSHDEHMQHSRSSVTPVQQSVGLVAEG